MKKRQFRELVNEKVLVLDGATGSNLLKRGMPYGVCPELWICENKEIMIQLQKEYIQSGSDIIYAPTFSGNRIKLEEYGLKEQIKELNCKLVAIAREAAGEDALVAGDITMTGAQLEPLGDLSFEELVDIYKEQILILVEAGVDLLVVETMMSLQETRAAVIAAKEVSKLPIMATMSFKENGKTLYGISAKSAVAVLQGMGVDAVGFNCSTGPDKMIDVVREMKKFAVVPIIAKPNAGMPKLEADGTTGYDMEAEEFAMHMEVLVREGANVIGGCCGTTPEFIEKIAKGAKTWKTQPVCKQGRIYLASEREIYSFEPGQKVAIGVDIDFSANEELREEYKMDIIDTVVDLAFDMEENADIIRIYASAEGIDEAKAILDIAEELSRNVNIPCMMATDSLETIKYVTRHFSGIMAIQWSHNLEEWEDEIKSIAKSYQVPLVTIDNEIIYC